MYLFIYLICVFTILKDSLSTGTAAGILIWSSLDWICKGMND